MNENILSEIFDDVYSQEFSEFDDTPKHIFSFRHRKAVKDILYSNAIQTHTPKRRISVKKRLLIVLLVILLSAIGIAACAEVSRSFLFKERDGVTVMTAAIDQNAPIMIDDYYYLPEVPQGFEMCFQYRSLTTSFFDYGDSSGRFFFFGQSVKENFNMYYNSEECSIEEIKINERPAVYFTEDGAGTIIWDNEDCILEVGGDFPKDELIALAESVKIEP